MNILVVDDNKNNRMILSLLLEDYMDDNNINFEVDEACDGVEAVEQCNEKEYNIVLMDIMMPNMDGIEATRIIRQAHPKIMIIAVSAVDDSERKKLILNYGAEDYISKPINSDIFNSRINNYITLIQAREHVKSNDHGVNIFTKEIFSRYTKFTLSSEESLAELWEYYLLSAEEKYDFLSDVIRTIFSIGEIQLKLKIKAALYEEESEDFLYFTLVGITNVPAKIIELTLKKNDLMCEYKILDDRLTFKLAKIITSIDEDQSEVIAEEETLILIPDVSVQVSATEIQKSEVLQIFDYIDQEDLYDLEEYSGRLSSLMLIVGSGDVTQEELVEMYTYIEKLGTILSTYSEVYAISVALSSLSSDMLTYQDVFIEHSEALGPMCTAFSKDLTNWIEMSFHTGAPSADFMNDTIVVNCQTIAGMLKVDEAPVDSDDFDDIFDF